MGSEEVDRLQTSALEMIAGRDAEIERLRTALKPFADLAKHLPAEAIPDHWPVRVSKDCHASDTLKVEHLRAALSVYEQ